MTAHSPTAAELRGHLLHGVDVVFADWPDDYRSATELVDRIFVLPEIATLLAEEAKYDAVVAERDALQTQNNYLREQNHVEKQRWLSENWRQAEARATTVESHLAAARAEVARLRAEVAAWQTVAVIAAIPLEAMRMGGSYRALSPSTRVSVDEAVVTIRMAVSGRLPPQGDIDAALTPARAALAPSPAQEKPDGR